MGFLKENIEFYDLKGVRQSSIFNNTLGYWKFELNFDSISTELFSIQQIHILENVINSLSGLKTLTAPLTTDSQKLKFKFKDSNYSKFFMYRIKYDSTFMNHYVESVSNLKDEKLNLQTSAEIENLVQQDESGETPIGIKKVLDEFLIDLIPTTEVNSLNDLNETTESFIDDNDIRNIIQYNTNVDALTLNLGFFSEEHGEFTETLEIFLVEDGEDDIKIAEIDLFCDAISEDKRLTDILDNFGVQLDLEDSIVFRETNVLDDKENHEVLNLKKKELILEYSNIIPFIGSYKGLINALKFYGYNDLKIKEWWLNLETEKFFHYEIDKETFKTLAPKETFGNGNVMKRTGKFSLQYDIFKLKGTFDENGNPEIELNFPYSQDEVLIKLYGLKTLLKKKYLPLNTRIIDITGHGIVFNRISTTTWESSLNITSVNDFQIDAKIEAVPTIAVMDQSRDIKISRDATTLEELENTPISELLILTPEDLDQNYSDDDYPTRKSYAKVALKNLTFDRILEDYDYIFEENDGVTLELLQTWPIYEMQYEITCTEGNGFYKKIKGIPAELETVNLEVDVVGFYDVTIKLFDVYNNVLAKKFSNLFKVELPEPKFGVLWNETQSFKTLDDASHLTLEEAEFDLMNGKLNTATLEDFEDATFRSLDAGNYLNQAGIKDTYRIPISAINRDDQYIEINKANLEFTDDLEKQTYLTFLLENDVQEIVPKVINSTNSDNVINITTNELPEVGDVIEVFEYETLNVNLFSIEKNVLTYPEALNISSEIRLYLSNSTDVAHLLIESFEVDEKEDITRLTVLDPDGILSLNYTTGFLFKSPRSYEVLSVEEINNGNSNITLTSTVDMNLDDLQEKIDSNVDIRCWWNNIGGRYSIPIRKIEELENSWRINLIDNERELFRITRDFEVVLAEYDINYAESRLGKTEILLEDIQDCFLEDLEHLEIDNSKMHGDVLTGFVIKECASRGMLRINNSEWFKFSSGCTGDLDLALEELQNSEIEEFKKYDFLKNGTLEQIHAVSKYYGEDQLAIIEFKGGLDIEPKVNPRYGCNYQIPLVFKQEDNYSDPSKNNRMYWNELLSEWLWHDETFEVKKEKADEMLFIEDDLIGNFQRHFSYPMNGTFRVYNTKCSSKTAFVKQYTIVSFFGDGSKEIIGKNNFKWKIYDDITNKIIAVTENEFFTFFFKDKGSFSVELIITDWNNNTTSLLKKGFIQVV